MCVTPRYLTDLEKIQKAIDLVDRNIPIVDINDEDRDIIMNDIVPDLRNNGDVGLLWRQTAVALQDANAQRGGRKRKSRRNRRRGRKSRNIKFIKI